ncbi:uncharacterized protein BO87DRAFT_21878 [Aspergillus neoniger CBS 115656]|uniref:Uncharacterized protein n=1 Tax=Aspergillus neoniger (strain CBS 115656) TaxID=1448310 RepID=A0A318YSJ2_ASPNB|nr:hypothetical protein BO87DRAFT_21878 [Aspergillus neoniger CBS 115656]PYH35713.1 hypothetical protein BO87DRAFT_21878 [Aspergillus neoniger CBS 115656]
MVSSPADCHFPFSYFSSHLFLFLSSPSVFPLLFSLSAFPSLLSCCFLAFASSLPSSSSSSPLFTFFSLRPFLSPPYLLPVLLLVALPCDPPPPQLIFQAKCKSWGEAHAEHPLGTKTSSSSTARTLAATRQTDSTLISPSRILI